MGVGALILAASAVLALWLAPGGMYIGLGLAIAALGLGWSAYRECTASGPARLCGAGAMTVGGVVLLLALLKVTLTSLAIDALDALF